jgi:methylated-DNA-[protein]-cysteine S-methyltransferase
MSAATLKFYICETEQGWVGLLLSPRGLRATTLPRPSREAALREVMELGASGEASAEEAGDLPERVRALVAGDDVQLQDHIDWDGISGFRRAVLEETLRIPLGQTRSYGRLAAAVGHPGAARAVGRVMATNPLPLVVPCHRVVDSRGALHGYGGGLPMKETLLRREGAIA